jgi:hypothetical protein
MAVSAAAKAEELFVVTAFTVLPVNADKSQNDCKILNINW